MPSATPPKPTSAGTQVPTPTETQEGQNDVAWPLGWGRRAGGGMKGQWSHRSGPWGSGGNRVRAQEGTTIQRKQSSGRQSPIGKACWGIPPALLQPTEKGCMGPRTPRPQSSPSWNLQGQGHRLLMTPAGMGPSAIRALAGVSAQCNDTSSPAHHQATRLQWTKAPWCQQDTHAPADHTPAPPTLAPH